MPGTRESFAVTREVANPGPDGSCTTDCIERVFGYDPVGNRDEIIYRGGYGTGFGLLEVTDRTDFRHGRPIRATRHGGAKSVLRWERETDPGTGLVRWHLSGSGEGFAYGYDPSGNLRDVVPIEADRIGAEWSIELQRTTDGQPLFGSRVRRVFPSEFQLLRHEVYDAQYSLTTDGPGISVELDHLVGDPMSSFEFDGLGRRARVEERYPSGSGTRVRLSLDFMTAGPAPCGTGGGTRLDHETRITLESEWLDPAWIRSCSDFDWNETQHDTLGRPAIVRLADGNEILHEYVGASKRTTIRSVGTSAGGSAEWLSTTHVNDALGRLRRLDEEVDGGEAHVAEYDYDRHDRLTSAVLWRGEPSVSSRQIRTFTYSDSGFLVMSDEPEKTVAMLGHDALGNTRTEHHGDVTTELFYDDIGRQVARVADGLLTATWTWGDESSGGGSALGEPAYGKVVETRQHNRFGQSDVVVTSRWSRDGPGARVDSKTSIVGGVGDSGDGFATTYAYDRWGEPSTTTHPIWTGWENQCQVAVEQRRERLGDWLIRTELGIADGAERYGSHLNYRANGRVELERFTAFGTQAGVLYEGPDPHGMARPGGFDLWWSAPFGGSGLVWTEGPYEYDGSGNVTRIGSRRYAYDGLDRLVELHDASAAVETFDFDRWGNLYRRRNTDSANGGGFTMLALGGMGDNRPDVLRFVGEGSGTLQWDPRGNLLGIPAVGHLREKSFVYSSEDRLMESSDVASGVTWRFAYDADGERVLAWRRAGDGPVDEVRFTLRDETGLALSDWLLVPETSFGPTTDYAHIGGRLGLQLDWFGDGAVARFAAHDHLGNTRVLVEPDGTVIDVLEYYPHGGLRSGGPVPGTNHLFTGHARDLGSTSSELDNMHARHYSPNLGFFTTIDAVGGDVSDSQSWNRYSYTSGNPLRAVDPDGRYEEDVHRHLTRYLALEAGRPTGIANAIAEANQLVDDTTPANPLFRKNFALHFGPRDQAVARARSARNETELGAALHSVQDSFSHAGYGWPFGHGHMNVIGKSPDDPWRDVPKAMEMAELTFELLGGEIRNLDREFLEILFRTKSKKERIDMLKAAMTPGGVGVPRVVGITFSDPEHLQMMIEYFQKTGYSISF
jgi:RHS repeat-associated protein